ncbi:hypothetical protein BDQ17DRAFT_1174563, partial [Cyathus striatus]
VIDQILRNLEPIDLLHLGTTIKAVRVIVFCRSAAGLLWSRVFDAHEDLPPYPDDMAGPAYSSLLFQRCCHVHVISF